MVDQNTGLWVEEKIRSHCIATFLYQNYRVLFSPMSKSTNIFVMVPMTASSRSSCLPLLFKMYCFMFADGFTLLLWSGYKHHLSVSFVKIVQMLLLVTPKLCSIYLFPNTIKSEKSESKFQYGNLWCVCGGGSF